MMRRQRNTLVFLIFLLLPGCLVLVPEPEPVPPPEAVLEGTWMLLTNEQIEQNNAVIGGINLNPIYMVFDDLGRLMFMSITLENGRTLSVPTPVATTSVDTQGNAEITALFDAGTFDFAGRLNTTKTRIERGDLTVSANVGGGRLMLGSEPATAFKQ